MPTDEERRFLSRNLFDFFKHMTTLATGSLLLIFAILEKFAPHPTDVAALKVAIGGLLIVILCSTITMLGATFIHNVENGNVILFFFLSGTFTIVVFPVALWAIAEFIFTDLPAILPPVPPS